ncbi:four helix bundle protein [Candidatus Kuenenbacteria bacterium RIFCSPLOWO2_02_FULL_42_16]|uniref:Four helix bundle protein n=1 Tax=Candidatus Kuenenbacteria bacterium RIFCSPLOWO2_02_FULL_42_16 TaxID=1798564 RepID=A0A1F6FWR7_9BACT|nr:MAG: four helix bundle protein [Candidatus Kuenenbacteria bacterium RIFCSPLOWO2_02_FULL_42_16]
MDNYIKLGDLTVYKTSILISQKAWPIYTKMDWHTKKIIGDQFITAIDSIGANVAEGYGRFHYLDRIKFYYNSRGSLIEAKHWLYLMKVREIISAAQFDDLLGDLNNFHHQLNSFIKSSYPKDRK